MRGSRGLADEASGQGSFSSTSKEKGKGGTLECGFQGGIRMNTEQPAVRHLFSVRSLFSIRPPLSLLYPLPLNKLINTEVTNFLNTQQNNQS